MKQLSEGLANIDQSQIPGKYKVWCSQFTLYKRVLWLPKMSEIPSSTADKLERKTNSFIRKWAEVHLSAVGGGRETSLPLLHHQEMFQD